MLHKSCVIKVTIYKSYAERHCQILFSRKFQAANIAHFGNMVYNMLPKWSLIALCSLILKINSFKVQIIHVSYSNIDAELFASYKDTYLLHFAI